MCTLGKWKRHKTTELPASREVSVFYLYYPGRTLRRRGVLHALKNILFSSDSNSLITFDLNGLRVRNLGPLERISHI